MIVTLPLLLLAQAAREDIFARGAAVFRQTCAVAYCHGAEGAAGRAPQLAGRLLQRRYLLEVIREGIPNSSMPGFKDLLSSDDLTAVMVYVDTLSRGPAPATAESPKPPARPPEAERGRGLFFDPARLPSCGTCHLLDGWGVAIAADLANFAPKDAAALRRPQQPRVKTANPGGESPFPALVAESQRGQSRLYDLTSEFPVLRTFRAGEVAITDGSNWTHAAATRLYSNADLEAILVYLRWLGSKR